MKLKNLKDSSTLDDFCPPSLEEINSLGLSMCNVIDKDNFQLSKI